MSTVIPFSSAAVFLSATLLASAARANDGTPPSIHALVQDGSGVLVTVELIDEGEPGIGEPFSLERTGGGEGASLFESRLFEPGDAASSEPRCRGGSWPECSGSDTDGDSCTDCDGDGFAECPTGGDSWCETAYYFDIEDQCVPEGETLYTLLVPEGPSPYAGFETSQAIDVSPWEGECEVSGGGGDGSGGCSVSGVGGGGLSAWTAAFMALVGLGALARRKKRR